MIQENIGKGGKTAGNELDGEVTLSSRTLRKLVTDLSAMRKK